MTLTAEPDTHLAAALSRWGELAPALAGLRQMLQEHAAPFAMTAGESYLDISCGQPVRGRVNRSHLRLNPCEHDVVSVVFYRASFRADGGNYGYGGAAIAGARLRPDQVRAWLGYLAAGLDASAAPRGVRAEFQFPVPE